MEKTRLLICSCCGQSCRGRQWWNRDKGYGLCDECADRIGQRETVEEMRDCYGEKGVHYYI